MSKIDEPKAMERAPIAEARMIFEAVASEIALRCIFLLLYTREREGYGSWTAKVKFLLLPASLMNATLMPSDVFVTGSRPFS